MKVVIIGGGTAGTTCAFELRKINKEIEITIIEKSNNLQYSPCSLPYVLSGEIKSFNDIFIFNKKDYENNNINLILNTKITEINTNQKKIILKNQEIKYDKLILATGSKCKTPQIKGIENLKNQSLKTIEDAKEISKKIKPKTSSVIIGAGIIGLELAASLASKNQNVSVIEIKESVLSEMLDPDMSEIIKQELEKKQIKFFLNQEINEIKNNQLFLKENKISFDNIYFCCGVTPNIDLAKKINLKTNKGIQVNEYLETSQNDIYACGDCTEYFSLNSKEKTLSQLGTTAVRQAKTLAKNILEKKQKFPPLLNNTISKINNYYIGSLGLTLAKAKNQNIKTIFAKYTGNIKAEYYSTKDKITIKLIADKTGKLIGGQIIGKKEVVGRLNLLSLAIKNKLTIKELTEIETCYNPASSPIFDPITITAEILLKKIKLLNN